MLTQETEPVSQENIISWGEDRARDLGATVENLMLRRGFTPSELLQDEFDLAA